MKPNMLLQLPNNRGQHINVLSFGFQAGKSFIFLFFCRSKISISVVFLFCSPPQDRNLCWFSRRALPHIHRLVVNRVSLMLVLNRLNSTLVLSSLTILSLNRGLIFQELKRTEDSWKIIPLLLFFVFTSQIHVENSTAMCPSVDHPRK